MANKRKATQSSEEEGEETTFFDQESGLGRYEQQHVYLLRSICYERENKLRQGLMIAAKLRSKTLSKPSLQKDLQAWKTNLRGMIKPIKHYRFITHVGGFNQIELNNFYHFQSLEKVYYDDRSDRWNDFLRRLKKRWTNATVSHQHWNIFKATELQHWELLKLAEFQSLHQFLSRIKQRVDSLGPNEHTTRKKRNLEIAHEQVETTQKQKQKERKLAPLSPKDDKQGERTSNTLATEWAFLSSLIKLIQMEGTGTTFRPGKPLQNKPGVVDFGDRSRPFIKAKTFRSVRKCLKMCGFQEVNSTATVCFTHSQVYSIADIETLRKQLAATKKQQIKQDVQKPGPTVRQQSNSHDFTSSQSAIPSPSFITQLLKALQKDPRMSFVSGNAEKKIPGQIKIEDEAAVERATLLQYFGMKKFRSFLLAMQQFGFRKVKLCGAISFLHDDVYSKDDMKRLRLSDTQAARTTQDEPNQQTQANETLRDGPSQVPQAVSMDSISKENFAKADPFLRGVFGMVQSGAGLQFKPASLEENTAGVFEVSDWDVVKANLPKYLSLYNVSQFRQIMETYFVKLPRPSKSGSTMFMHENVNAPGDLLLLKTPNTEARGSPQNEQTVSKHSATSTETREASQGQVLAAKNAPRTEGPIGDSADLGKPAFLTLLVKAILAGKEELKFLPGHKKQQVPGYIHVKDVFLETVAKTLGCASVEQFCLRMQNLAFREVPAKSKSTVRVFFHDNVFELVDVLQLQPANEGQTTAQDPNAATQCQSEQSFKLDVSYHVRQYQSSLRSYEEGRSKAREQIMRSNVGVLKGLYGSPLREVNYRRPIADLISFVLSVEDQKDKPFDHWKVTQDYYRERKERLRAFAKQLGSNWISIFERNVKAWEEALAKHLLELEAFEGNELREITIHLDSCDSASFSASSVFDKYKNDLMAFETQLKDKRKLSLRKAFDSYSSGALLKVQSHEDKSRQHLQRMIIEERDSEERESFDVFPNVSKFFNERLSRIECFIDNMMTRWSRCGNPSDYWINIETTEFKIWSLFDSHEKANLELHFSEKGEGIAKEITQSKVFSAEGTDPAEYYHILNTGSDTRSIGAANDCTSDVLLKKAPLSNPQQQQSQHITQPSTADCSIVGASSSTATEDSMRNESGEKSPNGEGGFGFGLPPFLVELAWLTVESDYRKDGSAKISFHSFLKEHGSDSLRAAMRAIESHLDCLDDSKPVWNLFVSRAKRGAYQNALRSIQKRMQRGYRREKMKMELAPGNKPDTPGAV